MASYKVLKSVAHNVGSSFTSLMNYRDNDYVMGHLLHRARDLGIGRFEVNLLSGVGEPADLFVGPIHDAVVAYSRDFPRMLAQEGSNVSVVAGARMTIEFDLATKRPVSSFPEFLENPYRCRIEIVDDRGKHWEAELTGWWFPEGYDPESMLLK